MAPIEIRPVTASDIPEIIQFDHSIETTHTWQMDSVLDDDQISLNFRKIRLPRLVKLDYPRNPARLAEIWKKHDLFLIARMDSQRCGYLTLKINDHKSGRIIDLVVDSPSRRQGVATALLVSAQDWLQDSGFLQSTLEIQIKNEIGIALAEKMGYAFCGYLDRYFDNQQMAVFYTQFLR